MSSNTCPCDVCKGVKVGDLLPLPERESRPLDEVSLAKLRAAIAQYKASSLPRYWLDG